MMSALDRAIVTAAWLHAGQVDKAGKPYILHPLRVMLDLEGEDAQVSGVLHDVLEDTSETIGGLEELGFSKPSIDAVMACTRLQDERYERFIERISKSGELAIRVKLADLSDNLREDRIGSISESKVRRYRNAQSFLINALQRLSAGEGE